MDSQGRVWGTAVNAPLTVFDPKVGEFTHFKDVISPYGVELDKNGNAWFAEFRDGGEIGVVDSNTDKVTRYAPPTPGGWPRRIEIAPDGMIWFAEYRGGRIDRFDPKSHVFKEYKLPGPDATPYSLGIDPAGYVWYSSDDMDVVGRLDPKTGNVIEYPYVHAENMMKEFFLDNQGRMWYGSPPNNKVGYFSLTESVEHAGRSGFKSVEKLVVFTAAVTGNLRHSFGCFRNKVRALIRCSGSRLIFEARPGIKISRS